MTTEQHHYHSQVSHRKAIAVAATVAAGTMNHSQHTPDASITAAQQDIRQAGLRATPARTATLVHLRRCGSPATHAEVAAELVQHGFDKATTFRNLNDLTDAGLLRRSELGDHVWRFEAVDPSGDGDDAHPHFLCIDCGHVTCLQDVKLTAGSRRQSDSVGRVTEILLRGHCHRCE